MIVRPIHESDADHFLKIPPEARLGIWNLPKDHAQLLEKITLSKASFKKKVTTPGPEEYLFVLEELSTGRIGGVAGIMARRETFAPSFVYRIETLKNGLQVLIVAVPDKNHSEVCSLYVDPTFRHSGLGRLLSLSRFLFMADHLSRFSRYTVAEIRGSIGENQSAPFWDGLGRHFCPLSYTEAMEKFDRDRHFVAGFLPEYPVYVALLPPEAQRAMGQPHDNTKPAYTMLIKEGFSFIHEVDLFEGGPTLLVDTDQIRSIKMSHTVEVRVVNEVDPAGEEMILSNQRLDFRTCTAKIHQNTISRETARALGVKTGETIRYVSSR